MSKVWAVQRGTAAGSWGRCLDGELREVESAELERASRGNYASLREATPGEVKAWKASEGCIPAVRRKAVENAIKEPRKVETAEVESDAQEALALPDAAPRKKRRARPEE